MRFAITSNNVLIYGPATWDARTFSRELGKLGLSVSFPELVLNTTSTWCGSIVVSPVVDVPVTVGPSQRCTGETLTVTDGVVTATPVVVDMTPDEINPPLSQETLERMAYENKYLEATVALRQLAGEPPPEDTWPKLEDTDFERIGLIAAEANPGVAGFLLATLNYTLSTLKYDYQWTWEQIEHREI
jgi:hypothetical protein